MRHHLTFWPAPFKHLEHRIGYIAGNYRNCITGNEKTFCSLQHWLTLSSISVNVYIYIPSNKYKRWCVQVYFKFNSLEYFIFQYKTPKCECGLFVLLGKRCCIYFCPLFLHLAYLCTLFLNTAEFIYLLYSYFKVICAAFCVEQEASTTVFRFYL